ncbi:hypothetical protein L1987_13563 [Smallanthus sonchifolius]|uniref:Uncharacterized protein n=1 Tax=Smallanthus sonchifolius TaxID=185202 RepID=A0ACB9JIY4_9ASTR|nr:hypothetical protein L1987_13563 [Smallanthus sonchifolius]
MLLHSANSNVITSQNEKTSDRGCEKGKSISEDVEEFVLRFCALDGCSEDFDMNENGDEGYVDMSHMYPYSIEKNSNKTENFIFACEEEVFEYKFGKSNVVGSNDSTKRTSQGSIPKAVFKPVEISPKKVKTFFICHDELHIAIDCAYNPLINMPKKSVDSKIGESSKYKPFKRLVRGPSSSGSPTRILECLQVPSSYEAGRHGEYKDEEGYHDVENVHDDANYSHFYPPDHQQDQPEVPVSVSNAVVNELFDEYVVVLVKDKGKGTAIDDDIQSSQILATLIDDNLQINKDLDDEFTRRSLMEMQIEAYFEEMAERELIENDMAETAAS